MALFLYADPAHIMTRDEFIRLVGPSMFNVTLTSNLSGIDARDLLRPAEAARQAGFATADVALRETAETIMARHGPMTLSHEQPLLADASQAGDFLSSGSLHDWALQLEERVFFWSRQMRASYAKALGDMADLKVLALDAGALFDGYADHLDLAPINSGAALRRPARRGPWLYVPATDSVNRFRTNRVTRELVKTPDRVAEVSLRCDIPGADLVVLRISGSA